MINKHIEIVSSSIGSLSSMGLASRVALRAALAKYYTNVGITIVNNLADLEALVATKPDLVFLGMKFIPSNPRLGIGDPNRIWVSDYLDSFDIPYTGSGQPAHLLELNKPLAKQRALDFGLSTSPFYVSVQNQPRARADMLLTFPLFIKPTDRGGGMGVDSYSVAHNFDDLESKVQSITTDLLADSLVEEYLPGREFSVAILKDAHSSTYTAMPIELVAEKNKQGLRILSEAQKDADTELVLEVSDLVIKSKISALALNVFNALGARDYGRIDIRLDKNGTPHFLEANLLPSLLKGYGNFPKACLLNKDLAYEPMLLRIVQLAFARTQKVRPVLPTLRRPISPITLPPQPALNIVPTTLLPEIF